MFPNAKLYSIVDTGLPTDEDHNYQRYLDNFKRVVQHHSKKITNYKINHPGYKVIFFVLDESSAYMESYVDVKEKVKGMPIPGRPHIWLLDMSFLKVIQNSGADYFIWFTPFKLINTKEMSHLDLPRATIYDVKKYIGENMDYAPIVYQIDKMMSTEI